MPNPMKLLKAKPTTVTPVSGQANRWSVTLQVLPQSHSDSSTRVPFYYDAQDIVTGDWFSNAIGGVAWKIISISSATSTLATVVVEDVNGFNTLLDPTGNLDGGVPNNIDGFVFTVSTKGVPVLSPLVPNVLIPQWQTDVFGRFEHLNVTASSEVALPAITTTASSVTVTAGSTSPLVTLSAIPQGATRTMTPQNLNFEWVDSSTKQQIRLAAGMNTSGQYVVTVTDTQAGKTSASTSITVQVNAQSVTVPAITANTTSPTVVTSTAANTVLATLSSVPSGATRTISDSRFTLNSAKTQLLYGIGITAAGTYPVVVTDTLNGATATLTISVQVTTTPTNTLPAPTITPQNATIASNSAAGTVVFTVSALTSGTTRSALSPNDGRFVWVSGSNQTQIAVGSTALSTGQVNVTFTDTNSSATPTSRNASASVNVIATGTVAPSSFRHTDYERPVIGSGAANVTYAPQMLLATGSDDIVGFAFNAGADAVVARLGSFALAIPDGMLQPTQRVKFVYENGTTNTAIQTKALKTWPSGAVKHLLVIGALPALTANQTMKVMLTKSTTAAPSTTVDHSALASSNIAGSLVINGSYAYDSNTLTPMSSTTNIGLPALLANAVAGPWRYQGPICSERRYTIDLPQAMRMTCDVKVYSDGTVDADYQIRADKQRWSNPNGYCSWSVTANITQGGTSVLAVNSKRIGISQIGRKVIRTALSATENAKRDPVEHNIQIDAPLYSQMGVLPPYDYVTGVANSVLSDYTTNLLNSSNWRGFIAANGITEGMGGTGGRDDIGTLPGWHAAWALTQSSIARRVMIAQGETAGATIINFWDVTKNVPLNIFDGIGYPGIWMDGRANEAGINPANISFPDNVSTDWRMDGGHQPMLPYCAYLLTGDHYFGELLESQGNSVPLYNYARRQATATEEKDWCVIQNNQPRESGWSMRDMAMAAMLMPDDSLFKSLFIQVLDYSLQVVLDRVEAWTPVQGELHGWLAYANPYDQDALKPWMQDHVNAGASMAYIAGATNAKAFIDWQRNWQIGRFLQDPSVFSHKDGSVYYINIGNSHDILLRAPSVTTWAQAKAAIPSNNTYINGYQQGGNYQQLARRTMVYYRSYMKDPDAEAVWQRYQDEGAPATSVADYRTMPLDSMRALVWKDGSGGSTNPTPTPSTNPPVVTSGQTFSTNRSVGSNTQIGTIASSGGTPVSGTVMVNGSASVFYEIRNTNQLWTRASLNGETTGTKTLSVTLTNADGSSTKTVSLVVADIPAQTGTNIFNTTNPLFAAYSASRIIVPGYAGPAFDMEHIDGTKQTVYYTNGVVDRSVVTDFVPQGASDGTVFITKLYDQVGSNHVSNTTDKAPRLTNQYTNTWDNLGGRLAFQTIYGRFLKVSGMVINSANLAAIAPVFNEYTEGSSRIISLTANGASNDYDNIASAGLLVSSRGTGTDRSNGSEIISSRSTVQIPDSQKYFSAVAYQGTGGFIQTDSEVKDMVGSFSSGFTTGTLRLGARTDDGDDAPSAHLSEFVLMKTTSKADIEKMHQNMKAFFLI